MNDRRMTNNKRQAVGERRYAAFFLVTGAGLLLHIIFDVPLLLTVLVATLAATLLAVVLRQPNVVVDGWSGARLIRVGLLAAPFALLAYDGSRFILTYVLGFDVAPWAALPHFGAALIGDDAGRSAKWTAGFLFHIMNGVGFSVAYVIIARDRGVPLGIAWGLALEAFMLGVYPSWLQIKQMQEFTTMSIFGHVCFGAALGYVSQRLLRRQPRGVTS
jgi:hypothetical protein